MSERSSPGSPPHDARRSSLSPPPPQELPESLLTMNQFENHNAEVAGALNLHFSKSMLDFNLNGSQYPVGSFVSDHLMIRNESKKSYDFKIILQTSSPKFDVKVSPMEGSIKKGSEKKIDVSLQFLCTTTIRTYRIGVWLFSRSKSLLNLGRKSSPMPHNIDSKSVYVLSFRGKSASSVRIDWDQLQVGQQIAEGGFGIVYEGIYNTLPVAIKKLHVQNLTDEDRAIFQREVEMQRSLVCQYVVTLMGYTSVPGQPVAIVMELLPNGTLTALIERQTLSIRLKGKITLDLVRGLAYMHEQNYVHRDLKPDNVLVLTDNEDATQNVKISDFDTARNVLKQSEEYQKLFVAEKPKNADDKPRQVKENSETPRNLNLSNYGTLFYKAPEMMFRNTNENLVDRADVFSIGMLMWHLWSQKKPYSDPPYDKMREREIENFIKSGKRLSVDHLRSQTPEVANMIERCVKQDPKDRPTMVALRDELSHLLTQMPKTSSTTHIGSATGDVMVVPPISMHAAIGWVGEIDRIDVVKQLEHLSIGCFMVRWSTRAESYVLSYLGRDSSSGQTRVMHIADIRPCSDGRVKVTTTQGEGNEFENLLAYVNAMREQGNITKPVVVHVPDEYDLWDKNQKK
eukprot:TRINITY_DN2621_c0_g1_i1.p1 TRINITY_DN2621_c0_g1~~TRINITY_DN2621_c0_g1_i1.p1  ORF type:complete len:627 (-),score=144.88 TRINITY_DN2621_c0_g1_i1:32-1912(-)